MTLFRVDHRLSKSPSLSFIFRPLFCPQIPQHNAVWRTMGEKQGPGMHNISIFFSKFFLDMSCLKSKPAGSMILLKLYYKSPVCVQYRRRTHLRRFGTDPFLTKAKVSGIYSSLANEDIAMNPISCP